VASNTDTLSKTGTGEQQSSQGRPERSRRIAVVWAGVAAALVAGLAFATFVAGDDPAVRHSPTSGEVQGTDDQFLPGSHNVPL
jgi:hypothetical protein